jgi:hypothetical protein
MPHQSALERVDILPHGARVADDTAGPFQHAFAFRREAVKTRATMHQQHAEHILKVFDARRKRRLADAAGFGGTAEMLFACQRDDEFEPIDHESLTLK